MILAATATEGLTSTLGLLVLGISAVVGLTGLVTILAFGSQKGINQRLEASNSLLHRDLGDEKARHEGTVRELNETKLNLVRMKSDNDNMVGRLDTLDKIFTGQSGPFAVLTSATVSITEAIKALAESKKQDHKLLQAHHDQAMAGQETIYALVSDVAILSGDKRTRRKITDEAKREVQDDA